MLHICVHFVFGTNTALNAHVLENNSYFKGFNHTIWARFHLPICGVSPLRLNQWTGWIRRWKHSLRGEDHSGSDRRPVPGFLLSSSWMLPGTILDFNRICGLGRCSSCLDTARRIRLSFRPNS